MVINFTYSNYLGLHTSILVGSMVDSVIQMFHFHNWTLFGPIAVVFSFIIQGFIYGNVMKFS